MNLVGKNDTLLSSVSSLSTSKNIVSNVNLIRFKGSPEYSKTYFSVSQTSHSQALFFSLCLCILLKYECSKAGFELKLFLQYGPQGKYRSAAY